MIRHPVPPPDLAARVDAALPTWRAKAKKRTAEFRKKKQYKESSSIWSEVKPLFMTLQGENKCIYCERKFGSVEASTVEHDLEHFRPKSHVDGWTPPPSLVQAGVKVTKPKAGNKGYYLLPYHLDNYSSSCKTCNTRYKLDRFPVAGKYKLTGSDPRKLGTERPLLIYPVGDWDVDPESVIRFHGFMPYALQNSPDFHRGLVTIAFFGLDDIDVRSDLFLERARIIASMYPLLEDANDPQLPADRRSRARDLVERYKSSRSAHANCARSFEKLFMEDRAKANECYEAADAYWASKS